ncbi:uncharacterized protein LOC106766209 [Vigna radiata var. radiata]|uniref:Uncharacterized protein LOC106766209 n=1 Tax=Vigna radiata var. radiata TaxID=3916 RepID=A0A1S3UK78_VIGRR|nr:uncharacterized protein LOC106766209 [Vigna radiata var. radiata]
MTKVVNGIGVPQLTRKTNYDNWCLQMKALLRSQNLWDMVEDRYVEPDEDEHQTVAQMTTLKKTCARDVSTLYFIYNAVDESGFKKIVNAKSKKEACEILEVAYKGDNHVRQVRIQAFRGEFEQLKMEPKEHITKYITWVEKVANQLGRNGEQIPSSRVVGKILRSLTKDFESIMCAIEESKDLSVLRVDELAGAEVLAVEGEEAEDEVDVANVILRIIVKRKPAGHIAKYCKTETKGETNLLTEDAEEECGILLLAKSSDEVDMENSIPTMDEEISVKDATIMEKENLEKEVKQKYEEI